MKITICGSIEFTKKIKEVSDELIKVGHITDIPYTCQLIIDGKLKYMDFIKEKNQNGDGFFRENAKVKSDNDLIKRYYNKIKDSDAVLILNIKKKDIDNYIGGNTFLEMGFAYVLDKPIYLYNPIPEISYKDEIEAMNPIVINKDLNRI